MDEVVRCSTMENLNAGWRQWLQRLWTVADRSSHDGEPVHLYLMIDSRANPHLDKLMEQVPDLEWTSLWAGATLETYTDIAPYLITIDRVALADDRSLHYRLARRLWREAKGTHMLTWMWSPLGLKVLGDHYRRYSTYTLPDKRGFYLHFYDNRILHHLREVWSRAEQRAFLGPCTEIWYADRRLKDVMWCNDDILLTMPKEGISSMTVEQHQSLLDLGYPDKLVLHLRTTCGAAVDHLSPSDLYERVSEQLERATRYQFTREPDLLGYVTLGVLVSPRFDEHPFVQERLLAAARGELTGTDALHAVDDGVWNQIRNEQLNG